MTPDIASDDFYLRLGLVPEATQDDVRRAYRALVRQYTPERAPEEFKRVRQAYETLSDAATRRQYDQRLDPALSALFESAMKAMKEENYQAAVEPLRQVLAARLDMAIARNQLGVCFLHLNESERALGEFQHLIREGSASPGVYANAGHAQRLLQQFEEAGRSFERAVDLATMQLQDATPYVLGAVDCLVDRGLVAEARSRLTEAIGEGKVAFNHLRYLTRLLELCIGQEDSTPVNKLLAQLRGLGSEPEEQQYVAWRLGQIAFQLLRAGNFAYGRRVALVGAMLQPHDADYAALSEVALHLAARNDEQVLQLVTSHLSFAPDGALYALRTHLESQVIRPPAVAPPSAVDAVRRNMIIWGVLVLVVSLFKAVFNTGPGSYAPAPYYPPPRHATATDLVGGTLLGSAPAARVSSLPAAITAPPSHTAVRPSGYYQAEVVDPFAQRTPYAALGDSIETIKVRIQELERQMATMDADAPAANRSGGTSARYDSLLDERNRFVKRRNALRSRRAAMPADPPSHP